VDGEGERNEEGRRVEVEFKEAEGQRTKRSSGGWMAKRKIAGKSRDVSIGP